MSRGQKNRVLLPSARYKRAPDPMIVEGWPSGLRRTPGKCVYVRAYREFESLPLLHTMHRNFYRWDGAAKIILIYKQLGAL